MAVLWKRSFEFACVKRLVLLNCHKSVLCLFVVIYDIEAVAVSGTLYIRGKNCVIVFIKYIYLNILCKHLLYIKVLHIFSEQY